jgi:hypothetical protein
MTWSRPTATRTSGAVTSTTWRRVPDRVMAWETRRDGDGAALDRLHADLMNGDCSTTTTRWREHYGNGYVRRKGSHRLVRKEHPDSNRKIDSVVGDALAYEARADALAAGWGAESDNRMFVFRLRGLAWHLTDERVLPTLNRLSKSLTISSANDRSDAGLLQGTAAAAAHGPGAAAGDADLRDGGQLAAVLRGRAAGPYADARAVPAGRGAPPSAALRETYDANNLDSESGLARLDRLVYGRSFVTVGTNEDDPEHPLISVESPQQMFAEVDPRTRRLTVQRRSTARTRSASVRRDPVPADQYELAGERSRAVGRGRPR